jgi:hypothetical protein
VEASNVHTHALPSGNSDKQAPILSCTLKKFHDVEEFGLLLSMLKALMLV